ncbi:MAG TPA: hypothetical protein VJU79_04850 [Candidatus Dormibacteraeota bacterium]|nr:hypothetical protein [Candidatus Dormibacteraeota bacterium]
MRAVAAVLARFLTCGMLGVGGGVLWRFTIAPKRIGIGSAFAGIFFLLLGFMVGGIAWYLRDVRRRAEGRIDEERLAFSLVVFVGAPFAVLVVIAAVWLLAFVIGAG